MNLPPPNDGTRPSGLDRARAAGGETEGPVDASIEAARSRVAPFDPAALRARAARLAPAIEAPPATPKPANYARYLVGLLALAAAVAVVPLVYPTRVDPHYVGVRGAERIALYELGENRRLVPWDGSPVAAGDVLGVRVRAGDSTSVVVLSVDGDGTPTVFWPDHGDAPEPLGAAGPDGMVALPGTIVLDAAPGPEVFAAVFDIPPSAAAREAGRAFAAGGSDGVRAWATAIGGDSIAVERR